MARRKSSRPHADLIASAIEAARAHIEDVGLHGFSLREVARRIGYTATSLIAWFGSSDLLVYHVGASALVRWRDRICVATSTGCGDVVPILVDAYFDFARDEPEIWRTLYSHEPKNVEVPALYHEALSGLAMVVISFVGTVVEEDRRDQVPALVNSILATMRGHCEADLKGSFDLVRAGGTARSAALFTVRDSLSRLGYDHG